MKWTSADGRCGAYNRTNHRCTRPAKVFWVNAVVNSNWVGFCRYHEGRKKLNTTTLRGPFTMEELIALEVQSS